MVYNPNLDESQVQFADPGKTAGDNVYLFICPRCFTNFEVWGDAALDKAISRSDTNKALRDYSVYTNKVECPGCSFPVNAETPSTVTLIPWGNQAGQWDNLYPDAGANAGLPGELVHIKSVNNTNPAYILNRNGNRLFWFTCPRCIASFNLFKTRLQSDVISIQDEFGFELLYVLCPNCNLQILLDPAQTNAIGGIAGGSLGAITGVVTNYGLTDLVLRVQKIDDAGNNLGNYADILVTKQLAGPSNPLNFEIIRTYGRYTITPQGTIWGFNPSSITVDLNTSLIDISATPFDASTATYSISGHVVDYLTGNPTTPEMAGLTFDIFDNGVLAETITTGSSGSFSASTLYHYGHILDIKPSAATAALYYMEPVYYSVQLSQTLSNLALILAAKTMPVNASSFSGNAYICNNPSGALTLLPNCVTQKTNYPLNYSAVTPSVLIEFNSAYYRFSTASNFGGNNYAYFPVSANTPVIVSCIFRDPVTLTHYKFRIFKSTSTPAASDGDVFGTTQTAGDTITEYGYNFTTPAITNNINIGYAAILYSISGIITLPAGAINNNIFATAVNLNDPFATRYEVLATPDPNNTLQATFVLTGLPGGTQNGPTYSVSARKQGYSFNSGQASFNCKDKASYPIQFSTNNCATSIPAAGQIKAAFTTTPNWAANQFVAADVKTNLKIGVITYSNLTIISNDSSSITFSDGGFIIPIGVQNDGWILISQNNATGLSINGTALAFSVSGSLNPALQTAETVTATDLNSQATFTTNLIYQFNYFSFNSLPTGEYKFTVSNHGEYHSCANSICAGTSCCQMVDHNMNIILNAT